MDTEVKVSGGSKVDTDVVTDVMKLGPTLAWRAIFAGAFISLLTYFILAALGIAIGGTALQSVIRDAEGGVALSWGAGIWIMASALASLFVGSFLAGRASGVVPTRIGGIQGLVIAALFYTLLMIPVGATVGMLGRGVGQALGMVGNVAEYVAESPEVRATIERALPADVELRAPLETVISNVAVRLMRGDTEAAKTYLARQSNLSREQVDRLLTQMRTQFATTAREVGMATARASRSIGWAAFATLLLGSFFSLLGGALGVRRTLTHPISERDQRMVREARSAWALTRPPPPAAPTAPPTSA